jgi:L-amino acid N-acyltransferase YncA
MALMLLARIRHEMRALAALLRDGNHLGLMVRLARRLPPSLARVRALVITCGYSVPVFPVPTTVTYRRLQLEDADLFQTLPVRPGEHLPEVRARFAQDLRRGHDGFVAVLEGKVVAYAWVAYRYYHLERLRFDFALGPDEAITFRSYVVPEHRYSRVYGGLATYVLTAVRARGVRAFFGSAEADNRHSIRTHRRMGYEVVGWLLRAELPFVDLQVTRLPRDGGRLRWRRLRRPARPSAHVPELSSGHATTNGGSPE